MPRHRAVPLNTMEMPAHAPRRNYLPSLTYVVLGCIILLGALLRVKHLGAQSLWMDEAATAAIASMKWSEFSKLVFSREMNMAAYYLIFRFFPFLLQSEVLLRAPSVLFGTGLIPAVWWLAKSLFDDQRPIAIGAALLAAANGFLIAYSQEARGYAMAVFFLVLATCALVVVVKTGRLRVTWCLLAFVALYSHLYAVLWLIPQVWVVWVKYRHSGWKFFRRIVAVASISLIPLLVFAFHTRGGQLDWVPKLTASYLLDIFVQIAGYSKIALLLLVTGSAVGCITLWRRKDLLSRLLVLEVLLPILILLACSPIHSLFVPRFLIFVIPFLIITALFGFASLGSRWVTVTLLSVLVPTLIMGNQSMPKGDWRSMAQYLCSQPELVLAFWPPMQRLPYWYYSRSNSVCPKPLSSDSSEPGLPDFGGDKREFSARLCSSEKRSILMVLESDWQRRLPAAVKTCYVPASVSTRDGLQLIRLDRLISPRP